MMKMMIVMMMMMIIMMLIMIMLAARGWSPPRGGKQVKRFTALKLIVIYFAIMRTDRQMMIMMSTRLPLQH